MEGQPPDCILCNSSPHLLIPVTPAQLMRPGTGQNVSCAVGDFIPWPAFLFREMWFIDCSCIQAETQAILASGKEAELQDSICTCL